MVLIFFINDEYAADFGCRRFCQTDPHHRPTAAAALVAHTLCRRGLRPPWHRTHTRPPAPYRIGAEHASPPPTALAANTLPRRRRGLRLPWHRTRTPAAAPYRIGAEHASPPPPPAALAANTLPRRRRGLRPPWHRTRTRPPPRRRRRMVPLNFGQGDYIPTQRASRERAWAGSLVPWTMARPSGKRRSSTPGGSRKTQWIK